MREHKKPGPGTMKDLADKVRERPATPEEEQELQELDGDDDTPQVLPGRLQSSEAVGMPDWVRIPADLPIPPAGVTMTAMRFEPEWTDRPALGERQCIVWNLSVGDEKFSRRRAKGDPDGVMDEQAKQMIRAIDGQVVNWGLDTAPNSPNRFWDEIGKKCRLLILNHYMKVHTLGQDEKLHFLGNCLAVRTVGPSPRQQTPRGRGR